MGTLHNQWYVRTKWVTLRGVTSLDRRTFLGAAAATTAAFAVPAVPADARRPHRRKRRRAPKPQTAAPRPPIGSGGAPTPPAELARIAREQGHGEAICFADLAALDGNLGVVARFAAAQGWAVRPAMKSFESPALIAYTLERLPEPRALIFHLRQVPEILAAAPAGTDLMTGYPPSVGELESFLARPASPKRHRVRVLVDSLELLERYAELARSSRRAGPHEVALQLESGMYLSGIATPQEMSEALRILRGARDRLRLTGVLCYDGYGSFNSSRPFRETMVRDCLRRWEAWLAQLAAEGADLYDPRTLVRNGPASSSYQLYAGSKVPNEISPGTAFFFTGYLRDDGYENDGLQPVLRHAAPVHRLPGQARMPLTGAPLGPYDAVAIKGGAWPTHEGKLDALLFPDPDWQDDATHGGRGNNQSHFLASPPVPVKRGDYVVLDPKYAGDAIDYFDTIAAVREGSIRRVWTTFRRPGLPVT